MTHLLSGLRNRIREFRKANRANVTVTFGLATVPIFGFVGAAIDYSHANSVKAAMQAAADSTALMLSKTASSQNTTQLNSSALTTFNALFTRPETTSLAVTAVYSSTNGSQVVVNASGYVKTNFMKIMGFSQLRVAVDSQVKWGNARLRVALALDNTGSMSSDGKMDALKTATKNLLTQLKNAAAKDGDVYVSIIPFSKDVNVGSSNYSASWIDWTEWEDEPPYIKNNKPSGWDQVNAGDSCPFSNNSHGFRCVSGPGSTNTVNNIPSSGTYSGYICPSIDNGNKVSRMDGSYYNGCYNSVSATREVEKGWGASCDGMPNCSCSGSGSNKVCTQTYYNHNWIKNARSTWTGCVVDRGDETAPNSGNYDTNVVAPASGNRPTLYAAQQYSSCNQAVMGLNYNWTSMTNLVNNMSPDGNTNQGLGLQLGWLSLVGGGPFTVPPKDANYKYTEVIILLTDGLNTQNRWYTSQSSIDTRQAMTCTNAKAAGITIYAVQVNTGGDPTQSVLQNCASGTDKFFMLTSSTQLVTTFQQIGTALSNLRIAQ